MVRPYSHSAADTQSKYRSVEELAAEALKDPIDRMEQDLVEGGVLTPERAAEVRQEAREIVAKAAAEALAARRPDPATVTEQVYVLPSVPAPPDTYEGGEPVPMGEAVKRTLHEVMAADEKVLVFGEDVADAREVVLVNVEGKGGVFGTTHGLQRAFGQARCFNTPLSEANIVGRAVGQAIRGLHPAPEIQFFDYIWPAMTQIKSEAATIRWRSNGAFTVPMVVRVPIGGYLTGGAIWHSQCGESIFAHVPGLARGLPLAGPDAAGLLRYAFQCDDPVLFLEHKHLLRQPYTVDPYPPSDYVIPFGHGDVRREGDDLTIVTWGATVEKSLQAARAGVRARGHRGRGRRPAHAGAVGPRARGRERGPHPSPRRRPRRRDDRRVRWRGRGVGERALLHRARRAGASRGRARHPRALRARAGTGRAAAGRRHRGRRRRRRDVLTLAWRDDLSFWPASRASGMVSDP